MTALTSALPMVVEARSPAHVRIDGAGHMLPLEVPKQLIILLKCFEKIILGKGTVTDWV